MSRAASALLPGAKCATHAQRPATGVCTRCGDYLCGGCGRRVGARLYCPPCGERVKQEHGPRAVRSLWMGLLSMHGVVVLAPFAIVFGVLELGDIRDGRAPVGGLWLARVGLYAGILGLVIPLSFVLAWFAGG
jgi:hypothetical protein